METETQEPDQLINTPVLIIQQMATLTPFMVTIISDKDNTTQSTEIRTQQMELAIKSKDKAIQSRVTIMSLFQEATSILTKFRRISILPLSKHKFKTDLQLQAVIHQEIFLTPSNPLQGQTNFLITLDRNRIKTPTFLFPPKNLIKSHNMPQICLSQLLQA